MRHGESAAPLDAGKARGAPRTDRTGNACPATRTWLARGDGARWRCPAAGRVIARPNNPRTPPPAVLPQFPHPGRGAGMGRPPGWKGGAEGPPPPTPAVPPVFPRPRPGRGAVWKGRPRPDPGLGRGGGASRPRRLDVHHDLPPLALPEPRHAQRAAREVAEDDGEPDVAGLEAARLLEGEAQAERHDDLRDDRDVERAACVARALEPARVGERDRDEEPGHAQVAHE